MNLLSSFLILALIVSGPAFAADTWRNPKGDKEVRLEKEPSPTGDLDKLAVNGDGLTLLAESNIRRENHGYGWMESAEAKWIDDRFLVFKDESGLAIIDVETNRLLLNQVLTGYSESPDGQAWAAIRRRNVPAKQDALTGNEDDTLWILDPKLLAANAGAASADHPFAHVPSVQLGGIVLAPPEWSEDGASVTLSLFSNGVIIQDTYNVSTRKRTKSTVVENPGLSRDQLLSLGFLTDVKNAIARATASGQPSGSGKEGGVRDSLRSQRREAVPEQGQSGKAAERPPTSRMALWTAMAIAFIAAIAFLIKRSGKI